MPFNFGITMPPAQHEFVFMLLNLFTIQPILCTYDAIANTGNASFRKSYAFTSITNNNTVSFPFKREPSRVVSCIQHIELNLLMFSISKKKKAC
jgi:hypothetical protein